MHSPHLTLAHLLYRSFPHPVGGTLAKNWGMCAMEASVAMGEQALHQLAHWYWEGSVTWSLSSLLCGFCDYCCSRKTLFDALTSPQAFVLLSSLKFLIIGFSVKSIHRLFPVKRLSFSGMPLHGQNVRGPNGLIWSLLITVGNVQLDCFICWDLHRIKPGKIPLLTYRKHSQLLFFFFIYLTLKFLS